MLQVCGDKVRLVLQGVAREAFADGDISGHRIGSSLAWPASSNSLYENSSIGTPLDSESQNWF